MITSNEVPEGQQQRFKKLSALQMKQLVNNK
jgi:hypothetical protein